MKCFELCQSAVLNSYYVNDVFVPSLPRRASIQCSCFLACVQCIVMSAPENHISDSELERLPRFSSLHARARKMSSHKSKSLPINSTTDKKPPASTSALPPWLGSHCHRNRYGDESDLGEVVKMYLQLSTRDGSKPCTLMLNLSTSSTLPRIQPPSISQTTSMSGRPATTGQHHTCSTRHAIRPSANGALFSSPNSRTASHPSTHPSTHHPLSSQSYPPRRVSENSSHSRMLCARGARRHIPHFERFEQTCCRPVVVRVFIWWEHLDIKADYTGGGVRSFYKGLSASCLGISCITKGMIQWVLYERLKRLMA
jgi:hypothetical protein